MACFYDMDELKVPFEQYAIEGVARRKIDEKDVKGLPGWKKSVWAPIYTLRVCKRCRADWLGAIEKWFLDKPETEDSDGQEHRMEGPGTGIFIRERGTTKEISEEEWQERNPDREPVRVVSEGGNNGKTANE